MPPRTARHTTSALIPCLAPLPRRPLARRMLAVSLVIAVSMIIRVLVGGVLVGVPVRADEAERPAVATRWGSIRTVSPERQLFEFHVGSWPDDGRLSVPTPFAPIVRCSLPGDEHQPRIVDFQFNADATELWLLAPDRDAPYSAGKGPDQGTVIRVETADQSGQLPDGRILFSALDARVDGKSARLESHPGNHRIGFWTNPDDTVSWPFKATRWGMYEVWLTYSCASPDGSLVEIQLDQVPPDTQPLVIRLRSTGSWYRYTSIRVGKVYLETAGARTLTVRCREKAGAAVMNLKAVLLQPACEGQSPRQAPDGSLTLHGRDATVHGTMLRWEPAEKKQTLGYWVNASDGASWTFEVGRPGNFEVEVLQGCGTGQGGSLMAIEIEGQQIRWEVEDTGHFQNFKPRLVGQIRLPEPGRRTLSVHPLKIAAKAACDIRQIRLIPRPQGDDS